MAKTLTEDQVRDAGKGILGFDENETGVRQGTGQITSNKIDKQHIYEVTQRINNNLHFNFGMTDLQDRMIITACALVAQRYFPIPGLKNLKSMGYNTSKNWIFDSLSKAIVVDKRQNDKLEVLLDTYSVIKISIETHIILKKWRKYSVIRTYKNKSKWLTTKLTTFCPRNTDCPILNRVVCFFLLFCKL